MLFREFLNLLKNLIRFFKFQIFIILFFNYNALSQTIDSRFGNWTLFEKEISEYEKLCYLVNKSIVGETDYTKREQPFLMISRSTKTRMEEISLSAGFEYKFKSIILVLINNKNYDFIANNNIAWPINESDNPKIIQKIIGSDILISRSDSAIGKYAIDEYDLKGFAKSYARMREICP
ncbi:MAG: hypothetical protein LW595_02485 [Rickettsiales bacterium]|jgi:hypothetical protein|nr:hypothetical protein [Rickettsiales bacterium]